MLRFFTALFASLLFWTLPGWAQQPLCGTDDYNAALRAQDPALDARLRQSVANWIDHQQNTPLQRTIVNGNDTVFEIPVVIHVMRPVSNPAIGNYNPPDAQLTGMIDYLNQTYAATWPSYAGVGAGGTAIPIRFVLAKRDTACNATTGILRVDASGLPAYATDGVFRYSTGAPDGTVKALSYWPVQHYYNIWVVSKIDGVDGYPGTTSSFVAGYASFPNGGYTDGTVMLASQAVAGENTLPHEIGHAFSLYHTFEGDNGGSSCPPIGPCATTGDLICDTEPHIRSPFNCPTGTNPCTGNSYNNVTRNMMDYSNCADRFTPGQRERILYSLRNERPGLMSSMGAVAPAATVAAIACVPTTNNPTANSFAGPVTVSLADMNAETVGGFSADGRRAYLDLSCVQRAEVVAGSTYPIVIGTYSDASNVRVYIDLNNNGTFAASELVYSADGGGTNGAFTGSWTVPATATTCTPLRMRVMADLGNPNLSACGPLSTGQAEDYTVVVRETRPVVTVQLAPGSSNPSCTGTPLTFAVNTAGTATGATYQWYINGVAQGVTTTSFTTSAPADADQVTVKVNYTSACGPDSVVSTPFVVGREATVAPTVSISLTSGSNPGCAGQSLTFEAIGTNTGTAPIYTWMVNGGVVATTSGTYTTNTLADGDVVTVMLTSNSSCATPNTATSAPITYTYGVAIPGLSISQAGGSPVCQGKPVTFLPTPVNGGPSPIYEWFVNNLSQGTTSGPFTYVPAPGDVVRATLYSSNPCVIPGTATSNTLTLAVQPPDTSRLFVALTQGQNPGCQDSVLQFQATVQNMGPSVIISWLVNGTPVANGPVFTTAVLQNGDVLTVRATTSDPGCRTADTLFSAPITIIRNAPPAAPIISFINNALVSNLANVQWYGPGGRIVGATGATYYPPVSGLYYAQATSGSCESLPSNKLQVAILGVDGFDISSLKLYPNPTTGKVFFRWTGAAPSEVTVEVFSTVGQRILSEYKGRQQQFELSLETQPSSTYFIKLRNSAGQVAVVPVVLKR